MYKVIVQFVDLQDNKHHYHAGDIFPRDGVSVSEERLNELSGSNNNLKRPLIEKIAEKAEIKAPEKKPVEKPADKVVEKTPEKTQEKKSDNKPKKGKKKSDTD